MPVSLVTGGAGFIGSHVADHLLAMGHKVVVLDDLSGGFRENVPQGAEFWEGSILEVELLRSLFVEYKFDYVFHLAAYAAEGLSHFIKRFNYENNLIGSVNLINAAVNHDVKCFVFTSSIAVYGCGRLPFNETMPCLPDDSYGIAKLAVEQELEISHKMFGLPFVIFRPHNVYGERQNIGDRYRNVIGIFMNQCLKREPMTLFGDGSQVRAFTHVADVAEVIATSPVCQEAINQVFNIGSDVPHTVKNLAYMVAEVMDCNPRIVELEARNEVRLAYSDHTRFHEVFGKRYTIPLREGLQRMAQWVKHHGARQSKEFENIEIEKNLPPSWRKSDSTLRTGH